jgi:hypothetical protein
MNTFVNEISLLVSPVMADAAVTTHASHWMEQLLLAMILLLGTAFVFQGTWNGLMAEFPTNWTIKLLSSHALCLHWRRHRNRIVLPAMVIVE